MGLIINQGVQDSTKDVDYGVIVEKNVLVKLTDIALHEKFDKTLVLEYTIMRGKYAQRKVWDNVSYDPNSEFSWKYRMLRRIAGCPYTAGEPMSVDIDALLLNKPFVLDLSVRKGKDGNEYQGVAYSKTAPAALMGGNPQPAGFATNPMGFGVPQSSQPNQNFGQPTGFNQAPQQAWGAQQPMQGNWNNNGNDWNSNDSNDTLDISKDDLPF